MSINVMTKREFDKALKAIKKDGETVTTQFSSLVLTGVALYWGESNRNIQVINDLIDCAKAFKGLRVKAVVEYLSNVIPHKASKSGDFHFGASDKKMKKEMEKMWEQFLTDNPDWDKLTVEKDPAPFNLMQVINSTVKKLQEAVDNGSTDLEGVDLFIHQIKSAIHAK